MSDTVQKLPERADCIKRTGEPCVGFKGFLERQYLSQRCHLDELDRLEAKLAKAMEALRPFAALADRPGVKRCADDADWQIDLLGPTDGPAKGYTGDFTTADLRRARRVVSELEDK